MCLSWTAIVCQRREAGICHAHLIVVNSISQSSETSCADKVVVAARGHRATDFVRGRARSYAGEVSSDNGIAQGDRVAARLSDTAARSRRGAICVGAVIGNRDVDQSRGRRTTIEQAATRTISAVAAGSAVENGQRAAVAVESPTFSSSAYSIVAREGA